MINQLDPIVVVYRFKSGRTSKAIPFSSGDSYVLAVQAANRRSDEAGALQTVEDAVKYESEKMDQDIQIIGYADNTDYGDSAISDAQRSLGWIA